MANPLYDQLFGAHAGSDRVFLTVPGGQDVTYDAFLRQAAQLAHALQGQGVGVGDRVAVQVAKSPQALALYAACAQMGAIFLPLNTAYTPSEVAYFVNDSGARVFVCDPGAAADLTPVADQAGAVLLTMGAQGHGTLPDMAATAPEQFSTASRCGDDLAAFLYTSGTTGRSKGAMLTQDNLLSNARTLTELWQFTDRDVLLHALPIFHTHGLFVGTNITLIAGGRMIFLSGFDQDAMIEAMPDATAMMGVPTFYTRLLGDDRFDRDLCKAMRLFVSGSAPLLADTHRQFESRTGHRILERYGMTETNMNTSNPYSAERRAGTVGLPLPDVELKVCAPDGTELPRGEIGIIEVRGPNVFKGYWQMPEKTAQELRADGFFITGDLAVQGQDGYVTIVGRAKDLVISGGFNVYPKEVEDVIDAHPAVLESAVIGVPHPDFGEGVVAIVVTNGAPLPDDFDPWVAQTLAAYKRPKHVAVVDALPRNTMGKVQKAALRAQFATLFS